MDEDRVAALVRELLLALGEDPGREGLVETPNRVAAWYCELFSSEDATVSTSFPEGHLDGQLVVVSGISVWSLCEHHLLPMHLDINVGYVPGAEVLGLSKFGRIARKCAGRLQVQERFTRQVADEVATAVGSSNVAVAVRGTHLCMSMRGVRMEQARTTTVECRGHLDGDTAQAQRFLALATEPWKSA
ncbi:GTP cyclohydrolase I [Microlunatus speluncae]|uniref:GTP cyclohydrolase I n=1 Tax=Microlunatus speluncae TaxID=2594267 RepID=UPI001C2D5809|nr:GTP cyclohydrolase I FolE [Microlunatus speluncae]